MTLVHLGDFHAAPGPRNADRYRALDQILGEQEDVAAWLWPGDLSHARQAIEDKNALARRLQDMASRAPVVLVYGNHDLPGDLDVFAQLHAAHPIYVISRPQCLRLKLATGEFASIFCLPYPTKAGLVAQGIVPADVVEVAADLLDPIFMWAAHNLAQAQQAGDLTLMVGHVNVRGSIMSAGQPNIGHEIELSRQHLDRLGPIYKGLNHVHRAQQIGGAYYPGSICRLSWGEIEDKEYLTVHYTDDGAWTVQHHPLAVAPMFHLEGLLTRTGFLYDDPTLARTSWAGCEVRVRYRYQQSEKDVLDERAVREPFRAALRLLVEPVAIPDRALRAPEVAAAHTLREKVTAWADLVGLDASRLLDKLARLETADPARLLQDVQAELSAEVAA